MKCGVQPQRHACFLESIRSTSWLGNSDQRLAARRWSTVSGRRWLVQPSWGLATGPLWPTCQRCPSKMR